MSDCTANGPLSGTKTTKVTKTTKTMWVFVIFVAFVAVVAARVPSAVRAQAQQQPTQAQQRPVFRGGSNFVRVDAYPIEDGKIVEGLTAQDFEILEDGKPQTIDSLDFVRFDTFTPEAERRRVSSVQEGKALAADPRYRVFVIYVDIAASTSMGAVATNNDLARIQTPLVTFLDRVLGPQDLFGFLTSRNSVRDLSLSQTTDVTRSQILDMWRASSVDREEADVFDSCGCGTGPASRDPELCRDMIAHIKALHRAEASYRALQDLVAELGAIRQERKNVVLVSNRLTRAREDRRLIELYGQSVPRAGIVNGRPAIDATDMRGGAASEGFCLGEVQRLANVDFDALYRLLLEGARHDNVSFYVITPAGLQAPVSAAGVRLVQRETDDLMTLASETGGVAIVNTNDLNGGMKRIADDLQAYYVLGYYTTNTKFDGRVRKLSVKVKGRAIRARREYRAPTEAEVTALASAPVRPAAPVDSGPPAVIGPPIAYRVSRAQPIEKVGLLEFVRADRLRVEWPILAPLDRREARMLDSAGKPMPFDLPVSESAERKTIVVELPLAPFGRGTYAIELTAGAGGKTEQRRLTFMMK